MSERRRSHDGESERSATAPEGAGESRPFIDSVFEALADWRRREICQFFRETDATTATVDELAVLLAAGRPAGLGESDDPTHEDLVLELQQCHLPRLDDAGVLDYDDRTGTVRYWGQPTVDKWLEHVTAVDRYDH